jgi:ABC-type glycerol-3-phosphate transport system substrate-binding protein
MAGLPLVGMVLMPAATRRRKHLRILAMIGLVLVMTLFMAACGGGGGSFGGGPQLQTSGTPAGTYTVTVTGNPAIPPQSLPVMQIVVQ